MRKGLAIHQGEPMLRWVVKGNERGAGIGGEWQVLLAVPKRQGLGRDREIHRSQSSASIRHLFGDSPEAEPGATASSGHTLGMGSY